MDKMNQQMDILQYFKKINMMRKLAYLILASSVSLGGVSCQKDAESHEIIVDKGVVLNVSVAGIETNIKTKSGQSNIIPPTHTQAVTSDMFAVINYNSVDNAPLFKSESDPRPTHKPMSINTTYAVLVYKYTQLGDVKSNVELVAWSNGLVGSATPITLPSIDQSANVYYEMVAYSYNDLSEQGLPIQNTLSERMGTPYSPEIRIPEDRDFLTYRRKILGADLVRNKDFSILFVPVSAKLNIRLDAGTITSALHQAAGHVTIGSGINKYAMSLFSGNVIETTRTEEEKIIQTFSFDVETNPLESVEVPIYFYKSIQGKAEDLGLVLNMTRLKIAENGKPTAVKVDYASNSNPYKYAIKDELLKNKMESEANIYFQNGFLDGTVLWAYGNLYYDSTKDVHKYRIRANARDGRAQKESDYWRFGGLIPTEAWEDTAVEPKDPCKEILPKNTWRSPSIAEFTALFENNTVLEIKEGQDTDDTGNSYRLTQVSSTIGSSIRFYSFGYYIANTSTVLTGALFGGYFRSNETGTRKIFHTSTVNGGPAEGTQTATTYDKYHRINIRCVRDL